MRTVCLLCNFFLFIFQVVYLIRLGGPHFYFYVWVFLWIVSIILMTIYPTFIAPLFNKYTPLTEGPVYDKVCLECFLSFLLLYFLLFWSRPYKVLTEIPRNINAIFTLLLFCTRFCRLVLSMLPLPVLHLIFHISLFGWTVSIENNFLVLHLNNNV